MDEAASHNNQRKLKRYQLTALVDIVERRSQDFVGRLVNLHTEGLMTIGDYPFQEDTLYQLDLKLPKNFSDRPVISIDVDCLWTRVAQEDSHTIWTGFSIYSCSEEAKSGIQHLLDEMGV
jgi:hypothetical protein